MKKNKWELLLEGWIETLNYLDRHKVQGRIIFIGFSINLILFALKYITDDLIKIIAAFR